MDSVALLSSRWAMRNRVSLIRVDLPEPETPVTQVITPMGRSRLTLRRLLPLAPLSFNHLPVSGVRSSGMAICLRPER
ncbi:hypothetical protein D3C81_2051230 [compost metagenome]